MAILLTVIGFAISAIGGCNDPSIATPASKLTIGTPQASFDDLVAKLGAKDVGKDMAIVRPRAGKIWEFADYVVVSVSRRREQY